MQEPRCWGVYVSMPSASEISRAPATAVEGGVRTRWLDDARHRRVVLSLLALLPLVVLLVRAPSTNWLPVGDAATAGLRTAEVGTTHSPLVGPYSHFGWSHPGPILYELLAIPYRVFGLQPGGLLVGALLINAAALAIVVVRLLRTFGLAVACLGIAAFGTVSWSIGTSFLWYPWNPNLCVLPFAALLVVTWTTARNSRWDLPLLALLGSFVAQTHVAYVPFVVVLVPLALVGRSRRLVPGDDGERPPTRRRTELFTTAGILVVLWLPTVIDAVLHDGGNLRALVDFWFSPHDTAGFALAARIVGSEMSLRAPWLGFEQPLFIGVVAPSGTPIPIAFLALLVAAGVAWRVRDRLALRCCLVLVATTVVATLSVARIVGLVYPYLLFGLRVIAAASWLAVGLVIVRLVHARTGRTVRRVTVSICATLAGLVTIVLAVSALEAKVGPADEFRGGQELSRTVARALPLLPSDRAVRVLSASGFEGGTYKAGTMLELLRHGHRVTTDGDDDLRFGRHYAHAAEDGATTLLVTSGSQQFDTYAASGRLLARSGDPTAFPAGAPRMRPDEDPHVYLARVRDRVDASTYQQLERYLTSPYPIAVFERP